MYRAHLFDHFDIDFLEFEAFWPLMQAISRLVDNIAFGTLLHWRVPYITGQSIPEE